jgi:hypothetical protein
VTRRRGSILRLDVPLAVNNNGQSTQAGLGDTYVQDILNSVPLQKICPRRGQRADPAHRYEPEIGNGEMDRFSHCRAALDLRAEGFFVVKLQEYVSFAGDSKRPDINYFSTLSDFRLAFSSQMVDAVRNRVADGFRAIQSHRLQIGHRSRVHVQPKEGSVGETRDRLGPLSPIRLRNQNQHAFRQVGGLSTAGRTPFAQVFPPRGDLSRHSSQKASDTGGAPICHF